MFIFLCFSTIYLYHMINSGICIFHPFSELAAGVAKICYFITQWSNSRPSAFPKTSIIKIIRELQKPTPVPEPALEQLGPVLFSRAAYCSTEHFSRMQVPGGEVPREFEAFYGTLLQSFISIGLHIILFITESFSIANVIAVRAWTASIVESFLDYTVFLSQNLVVLISLVTCRPTRCMASTSLACGARVALSWPCNALFVIILFQWLHGISIALVL